MLDVQYSSWERQSRGPVWSVGGRRFSWYVMHGVTCHVLLDGSEWRELAVSLPCRQDRLRYCRKWFGFNVKTAGRTSRSPNCLSTSSGAPHTRWIFNTQQNTKQSLSMPWLRYCQRFIILFSFWIGLSLWSRERDCHISSVHGRRDAIICWRENPMWLLQFSCIDCGVVFDQQSVQTHSSCISEAVCCFFLRHPN